MSDNLLLYNCEKELQEEAIRLVPLTYNQSAICFCCGEQKMKKLLNPKYKFFDTEIYLRLVPLCCMKHEGEDYEKANMEYGKTIKHFQKYRPYKEETDKIDMEKIVDLIASDISKNKYENDNLFVLIPNLAKKYMKVHNDSVDYRMIIWLLNNSLKKMHLSLNTSSLKDLVNI